MSVVKPAAVDDPGLCAVDPQPDETWRADLLTTGPAYDRAIARLHQLLVRATRHQVWRLRSSVPTLGAGDLEDLAQQAATDALMAVLRQLNTFEGRSRFTTWVYKFGVLHAGVAVRRQGWRHREIPLSDTVIQIADTAPTPAAVLDATQLARAVQSAIATELTPHQRRIAVALIVEQVPIDVLAEHLGTTRNALYKTLHDARRRLRAALTASGHLDSSSERSIP